MKLGEHIELQRVDNNNYIGLAIAYATATCTSF